MSEKFIECVSWEKMRKFEVDFGFLHLFGAPSGRMFQRVKVPNPPDSGKDIAKSKGVLGNWESEGSWRQITGLTNRNHEG